MQEALCCPSAESSLPIADRVTADGATGEWTPIDSGVPLSIEFGPTLFIQYTSEMFELVELRLYTSAEDFRLYMYLQLSASKINRTVVAPSLKLTVTHASKGPSRACHLNLRIKYTFTNVYQFSFKQCYCGFSSDI